MPSVYVYILEKNNAEAFVELNSQLGLITGVL